ncbi:MAG: hypothetical protein KDB53_20780, partial [Planctomycetes bacterium]|nr:hypothetical protein [Planctomycetota bacterium]
HDDEDARRERFVAGLQDLLAGLPPESVVDSTLRATEVVAEQVRETLFSVQGRELAPISRVRPINDEDRRRLAARRRPTGRRALAPPLTASRRWMLAAGIVLGLGFLSWQLGFIDRILAPKAATLEIEAGLFEGLIDVAVADQRGNYLVTLRRGPDYPADRSRLERLLADREDIAARAALQTVADGRPLYLELRDASGRPLVVAPVASRRLLVDPEARVELVVPGLIGAHWLGLLIDATPRK